MIVKVLFGGVVLQLVEDLFMVILELVDGICRCFYVELILWN